MKGRQRGALVLALAVAVMMLALATARSGQAGDECLYIRQGWVWADLWRKPLTIVNHCAVDKIVVVNNWGAHQPTVQVAGTVEEALHWEWVQRSVDPFAPVATFVIHPGGSIDVQTHGTYRINAEYVMYGPAPWDQTPVPVYQ